MHGYVVVIGSANIDIGGNPYSELIPADSNPGKITIDYGGVGRNIAQNICQLGIPVKIVTAIGGDLLGRELIDHCRRKGMDVSHVIIDENDSSSMYLYINDHKGDMKLAIDHINIKDKITPEYLDSIKDVINGAEMVVTDANISEEAFAHLIKICKVPVFADPVSTILSRRIKPHLDGLFMLKPNTLEAEYMTGMTIRTEEDYKAAAEAIIKMGVENVFISMGDKGMLAADINNMYITDIYPADVVSTTGAGDSAMAAIVWAFAEHDEQMNENILVFSSKAANAAASMTVSYGETINPSLSSDKIYSIINSNEISVRRI